MTTSSGLYSPIKLGPLSLPNRIMVSPMCHYSAVNGNPVDWHLIHLGTLAISGAGLLCVCRGRAGWDSGRAEATLALPAARPRADLRGRSDRAALVCCPANNWHK